MEYLSECSTLVPHFYINIYMKECSNWSLNILHSDRYSIQKGEDMKVRFLEHVIISDTIYIEKGKIFEAKEEGDFIMIRMKDDSTVKAPKAEIKGILEVIE